MSWLLALVLLSLAGWAFWRFNLQAEQGDSVELLLADLDVIDQVNADQHRQARQAMNRAAGQDWRNLAG